MDEMSNVSIGEVAGYTSTEKKGNPQILTLRAEPGTVLTGFKLEFGSAGIDLSGGNTIGPCGGPVGEDGLVEVFRLVDSGKRPKA